MTSNSCKFKLMARDMRAIIHQAWWETEFRPQQGERLVLPAPQGATALFEVERIEHSVTGILCVWISMSGLEDAMVASIFDEILAETGATLS